MPPNSRELSGRGFTYQRRVQKPWHRNSLEWAAASPVRSSELLSRGGLNDSPSRWMDPARSGHTDGSQAWTQDKRFADLAGLCHSGVGGVTSGRHLHASQAITTSPTNSSVVNQ